MPQIPNIPTRPGLPPELLRQFAMEALNAEADLPPPPMQAPPTPAAAPAPQGGGLGGLVGLARATGIGLENNQGPDKANVYDIQQAGPATSPGEIMWNSDRSMWRYPASNAWHPAAEQPK